MRLSEITNDKIARLSETRTLAKMIGNMIGDDVVHARHGLKESRFITGHNREIGLRRDQKGIIVEMKTEIGTYAFHYPKDWSSQRIAEAVSSLFKMKEESGEFDPTFKWKA